MRDGKVGKILEKITVALPERPKQIREAAIRFSVLDIFSNFLESTFIKPEQVSK